MKWMRRVYNWIRFGMVHGVVKGEVGGVVSEIAYYDRRGRMVGYWAYGYFDPSMPYNTGNKPTSYRFGLINWLGGVATEELSNAAQNDTRKGN